MKVQPQVEHPTVTSVLSATHAHPSPASSAMTGRLLVTAVLLCTYAAAVRGSGDGVSLHGENDEAKAVLAPESSTPSNGNVASALPGLGTAVSGTSPASPEAVDKAEESRYVCVRRHEFTWAAAAAAVWEGLPELGNTYIGRRLPDCTTASYACCLPIPSCRQQPISGGC